MVEKNESLINKENYKSGSDSMKERIKHSIINQDYSKYISGIYNYCDRWCERCSFTSKCANFSLGNEIWDDTEDLDIQNEKFWKKMGTFFEAISELLVEMAEEQGIDLNEEMKDAKPREKKFKGHPLAEMAKDYSLSVHQWLKEFHEKYLESGEINDKELGDKVDITDAFQVLQWYSIFISAKIDRAFFMFEDMDLDDDDNDVHEYDSNGSAKIAIIAIDRSIGAFSLLLQHFKNPEEEIKGFLLKLSKVKQLTIEVFPNAMAFIRPGFDEEGS